MKKHIFKISLIIFLTVLAAALAIFMLIKKIEFGLTPLQIVFICLAVITGAFADFFLHILFHETGHFISGKLNGFKLYNLRIWFISLEKRNNKKGFRFKFSSSKYGGVTQMISVSEKNLYKKFGLYVLGGLIGSFIAASGFLSVLLLVNFKSFTAIYIYAALLAGFPLSVYFLFLNAIPFSNGGLSNDGGIIKGLLRKSPETLLFINVLTIQSKLYAGLSPSKIEEKLYFDIPIAADNCLAKVLLFNLQYYYYLDKLDFEKANSVMQKLNRIKRYVPEMYLNQILADNFFNTVFYLKNFEEGKILYSKIKDIPEDNDISALRIKMTYQLFILNDTALALETAKAALELKDSYPLKGLVETEEKLINILKSMANEKYSIKEVIDEKEISDS